MGSSESSHVAHAPDPGRQITIAHLSDLHLTNNVAQRTIEGVRHTNRSFESLIRRHLSALRGCDAITITGDITDSGRPEEWEAFLDLISPLPRQRLVLAPGNHDLNIARHRSGGSGEHRHVRLIRCLAVLEHLQGDRAQILVDDGSWIALKEYLQRHRWLFEDSDRSRSARPWGTGTQQQAREIERVWQGCFPMMVRVESGVSMLVLDSVADSRVFLTNALGKINSATLARLRTIRRTMAMQPWIVLLHHNVGTPAHPHRWRLISMVRNYLMHTINASALLDEIQHWGAGLVLHGHLHRAKTTRNNGLTIVSASSTTCGDEDGDDRPSISLLALAPHALRPHGIMVHSQTRLL